MTLKDLMKLCYDAGRRGTDLKLPLAESETWHEWWEEDGRERHQEAFETMLTEFAPDSEALEPEGDDQ